MATGSISRDDRRAVALLGVASLLLQLPFLDRGLSPIDEGSMLAIAEALAGGDVLYRDRATFISPLMYEWMGLLLRTFGSHLLVGRLFQLLVFSGVVTLVYAILRYFVTPRWAVLSASALCVLKPLALPLWTIPNYNQLGMFFALAATAATLRHLHRPGWAGLVCAGVAIGLTVVTKVSLGDFNRRGWNVAVSNIYDYRQKIFLYTIAQVAYNTDCCGFSVGWRRFAIGAIRNENQIRVSLSIANVGSFGTLAARERLF